MGHVKNMQQKSIVLVGVQAGVSYNSATEMGRTFFEPAVQWLEWLNEEIFIGRS